MAIFIISLLHRGPDSLVAAKVAGSEHFEVARREVRQRYAELREEGDPATFEEFEAEEAYNAADHAFYRSFVKLMVNENVIDFMARMHWRKVTRDSVAPSLLLSDDPLLRTNGFAKADGHFAFPLSPEAMILAFYEEEFASEVMRQSVKQLFVSMNMQTVGAARHFVVARDEKQTRFIRNRFGLTPRPPFGEQMQGRAGKGPN